MTVGKLNIKICSLYLNMGRQVGRQNVKMFSLYLNMQVGMLNVKSYKTSRVEVGLQMKNVVVGS